MIRLTILAALGLALLMVAPAGAAELGARATGAARAGAQTRLRCPPMGPAAVVHDFNMPVTTPVERPRPECSCIR